MLWRPAPGRQNPSSPEMPASAAFKSGPCHAPVPYPSFSTRAALAVPVNVVLITPSSPWTSLASCTTPHAVRTWRKLPRPTAAIRPRAGHTHEDITDGSPFDGRLEGFG